MFDVTRQFTNFESIVSRAIRERSFTAIDERRSAVQPSCSHGVRARESMRFGFRNHLLVVQPFEAAVHIDANEPTAVESDARVRGVPTSSPWRQCTVGLVSAFTVTLSERIKRAMGTFKRFLSLIRRGEDVNVDVVPHTQLQSVLRRLQHCVVML